MEDCTLPRRTASHRSRFAPAHFVHCRLLDAGETLAFARRSVGRLRSIPGKAGGQCAIDARAGRWVRGRPRERPEEVLRHCSSVLRAERTGDRRSSTVPRCSGGCGLRFLVDSGRRCRSRWRRRRGLKHRRGRGREDGCVRVLVPAYEAAHATHDGLRLGPRERQEDAPVVFDQILLAVRLDAGPGRWHGWGNLRDSARISTRYASGRAGTPWTPVPLGLLLRRLRRGRGRIALGPTLPRGLLTVALHVAAFRSGLFIAGFARLFRGPCPSTVVTAIVAPLHALRLGGQRRGASEHHDGGHESYPSPNTHPSWHAGLLFGAASVPLTARRARSRPVVRRA